MIHGSHSTTLHPQHQSSSTQSAQQHMQLTLSSNNQQNSNNMTSSQNNGASSSGNKNLPQMPPLSAVTYSHLHSVIGSMPIYDMADYQHL